MLNGTHRHTQIKREEKEREKNKKCKFRVDHELRAVQVECMQQQRLPICTHPAYFVRLILFKQTYARIKVAWRWITNDGARRRKKKQFSLGISLLVNGLHLKIERERKWIICISFDDSDFYDIYLTFEGIFKFEKPMKKFCDREKWKLPSSTTLGAYSMICICCERLTALHTYLLSLVEIVNLRKSRRWERKGHSIKKKNLFVDSTFKMIPIATLSIAYNWVFKGNRNQVALLPISSVERFTTSG